MTKKNDYFGLNSSLGRTKLVLLKFCPGREMARQLKGTSTREAFCCQHPHQVTNKKTPPSSVACRYQVHTHIVSTFRKHSSQTNIKVLGLILFYFFCRNFEEARLF